MARAGISGTNKCPCIPIISINEWVELFYVILSLSSKTVLGSLILINALRDNVTFRNRGILLNGLLFVVDIPNVLVGLCVH